MRCTQCGATEFMERPTLTREGDKIVNTESFICLNCGHVEWYVNEIELSKLKDTGQNNKKPWSW